MKLKRGDQVEWVRGGKVYKTGRVICVRKNGDYNIAFGRRGPCRGMEFLVTEEGRFRIGSILHPDDPDQFGLVRPLSGNPA